MRYTIDVHPGYIRAEMREREAGEETRAFVEAILAALRQHKLQRLLISVRASRPVFKVEQYGLSEALLQVAGSGLRVAFISDTRETAMSQEYIAATAVACISRWPTRPSLKPVHPGPLHGLVRRPAG
jgi:hypothetical protein